jgi:hypothetical protein
MKKMFVILGAILTGGLSIVSLAGIEISNAMLSQN